MFRRLAVFAGDFSLEAALAIGAPSATPVDETVSTFDLLASLVEKNLLSQRAGLESEPRFRMLETVREFAREQLQASGEAESVRHAHAAFYVAFVEETAPLLRRALRERWLGRIAAEMDNLRSVVAWSSAGSDRAEALLRIMCALPFVYWRIRGDPAEGLRWGELALATPATSCPPPTACGCFARPVRSPPTWNGWLTARLWLEECEHLARASGDRATLGVALVFLGFTESHLREPEAASHLGEGLATLRTLGDLDDLVLALNVAIAPFVELNELAAARAALDECLALARELGDDWAIAVALSNAGFLDLRERNWPSAGGPPGAVAGHPSPARR